ncbi:MULTISPECIES: phosphoenolpyruvate hydrolase family protein [Clostridia]|uniref:phosphoenolpyruvate hydrolase family protein n=1 Tax=Clostridia TaxID=186801 RepID=UPI000EA3A7ED|nr:MULTISPECIES: phosphoenolpyruvate hydrolase family protein [Clostridia]NBJ70409.1 helix-turn-helix domain-containing protein [Roseburia sp. 1XD42-34]RKI76237.1 helix-turn-helix domain-containing protein [Clostridium sp. 1xD42-85]
MKLSRSRLLETLNQQIKTNKHIIGVAAGSGLTAKYAEQGGADFILALSSGRFRQMGVSSLAGFTACANSNEIVMNFATQELLPIVNEIPTIFGLFATDPTIHIEDYIRQIKWCGFAGINNYPTVGLIDGQFRESLEAQGLTFAKEVTAIQIANQLDLFTVAFVFNQSQAIDMLKAGADVICVHLGLTTGGVLGAKQIQSLQSAKRLAVDIFNACDEVNPNVIKMVYGGSISRPIDVQFMYDGTDIDGYIGGSAFERIPAEQVITTVTKSFKETYNVQYEASIQKIMEGFANKRDYVDFIKDYISHHYMEEITLNDLAAILNLSRTYLSTLFKTEVGVPFVQYLVDFRLNRAIEMMKEEKLPLVTVAEMVGYPNYTQFSKIFKKRKGVPPTQFFKR